MVRWRLKSFLGVAVSIFIVAILLSYREGEGSSPQPPSPKLLWLGTLGGPESEAYDVSADGSVVVGRAQNTGGYWRAFRWMEAGGMEDLGTLGGPESAAYGVSADGLVVVGYAVNKDGYARAFRWTVAGGMRDLGTLGGDESHAYDVSKDGSVVVGWTQKKDGLYESLFHRAFRWTLEGGMQDLGTIGNANWTEAHGVSADGSVVVGWAGFFASGEVRNVRAFRWTMMRGMQNLGTPLGAILSWAHSVSADGSAVVGWGEDELRRARAFRWTQAGGMRDLGTLPTTFDEIKIWRGWAYGVSADGSVVVGLAKDVVGGEQRAFRWTQAGGMEDLNRTYASLLSDGSRLEEARAISPDARYIVGRGYNGKMNRKEAFLLDTGGNRQ